MNKFLTVATGAAVAVAISLSMATPSSADPAGDAIGAGLLGGFLGFAVGAAAADSGAHVRVYRGYDGGSYAWRRHVRLCYDQYGDAYDPRSDTFVGYDGYDHRCRL